MKLSHHYSPLRYPGGKSKIFPFVAQLLSENNLIGTSYAEPYAGGAGLALRLLYEGYVDHIYINDLDYSIYAFWKAILENTEAFCGWIDNVDISLENWWHYRNLQGHQISVFECAKTTFFLNRTTVSGILKGSGVIGGYKQNGTYKIDARFNKKDLICRIKRIAQLKPRIHLSNIDGIAFIKRVKTVDSNVFIYADPPYFQKGSDLYLNFYAQSDHCKLSKHIKNIHNKWMVSYDNHEFIHRLYEDNRKIMYKLSHSTSNRVAKEILIFSDTINFDRSMLFLKDAVCV